MVVESWGIKGGFHYFSENVSPAVGASYTGSGSNNLWTQLLPCTNSIYNLNHVFQFATLTLSLGDIMTSNNFPT